MFRDGPLHEQEEELRDDTQSQSADISAHKSEIQGDRLHGGSRVHGKELV